MGIKTNRTSQYGTGHVKDILFENKNNTNPTKTSGAPEGKAVPVPLVALFLLYTRR
jgi:hypothetical protein